MLWCPSSSFKAAGFNKCSTIGKKWKQKSTANELTQSNTFIQLKYITTTILRPPDCVRDYLGEPVPEK